MIYILHHKYFLIDDIKKYKKEIEFIEIPLKKNKNIILRIIRKIHLNSNFKLKDIWLDKNNIKDIKKITDKDVVIFFDTLNSAYLDLKTKYFPKTKSIFWLWNKIEKRGIKQLEVIKKNTKSIWTFDKKDSSTYGILYTTQFYWRESFNIGFNEEIDIFFIGQDKNRISKIDKIATIEGLNNEIYIIREKEKIYSKKYEKYLRENTLSYEEVITKIKKSKCLLEINLEGQEGITLRTLEALFFNKKLITNNIKIKEYDFYNENNIYVINDKNISNETLIEIKTFLKLKKQKINDEILKKYTFEFWLKKVLNN